MSRESSNVIVGMAATRPRTIFPSITSLNAPSSAFAVRSPNAIVYLCEKDELYRGAEYEAYLETAGPELRLREVADCHDWPITNPVGFEERLRRGLEELADSGREPTGGGATAGGARTRA